MDGVTLSEMLHNRGINIRYLGKIADSLSKIKQLEYLYNITVAEILTRTVKHVFTVYMQVSMEIRCTHSLSLGVYINLKFQLIFIGCIYPISQSTELMSLSAAVSHFLNCFLSSCPVPHPHQAADEVLSISFIYMYIYVS
jgi:protein TIF31